MQHLIYTESYDTSTYQTVAWIQLRIMTHLCFKTRVDQMIRCCDLERPLLDTWEMSLILISSIIFMHISNIIILVDLN